MADLALAGEHPTPFYDFRYVILVIMSHELRQKSLEFAEVHCVQIHCICKLRRIPTMLGLLLNHLQDVCDHFPFVSEFRRQVQVIDGEQDRYFMAGVVQCPILIHPYSDFAFVVHSYQLAVYVKRAEALVKVMEGVDCLT